MRILVCEPHVEVRELLGHVVERLGHEPVYPTRGHIRRLPEGNVDVILLEPADPDAVSTAETLRDRCREVPIVCASIYPDSEQAARLRPVAYLVKPFGLADLERALAAAVASVAGRAGLAH